VSDQQEIETFIGRTRELDIYQRWLNDPKQPWILSFYDQSDKKGGIGKTWLLHQCVSLTKKIRPDVTVVRIDFFNVLDRGSVTIAIRVADEFQKTYPDWKPMAFLARLQEFQQTLEEGGADVAVLRSQIFEALHADLQQLEARLKQTGRALVIFFDTYELVESDPVIAVLAAGHTFPETYDFKQIGAVIAGRNPLDWKHPNWRGREREVLSVPMNPFSREEMIEYIKSRSFESFKLDERNVPTFYERTEGRPILVGLAVDMLNYQLMSQEDLLNVSLPDFEATLVTQVNNLSNPTNWLILFMAHAYHRFNFELLNWMLEATSLQALVPHVKRQSLGENLLTLSFVRKATTSDEFVLHDEMRRLIVQYCWNIQDLYESYRREVSRCALGYYEQKIRQISDKNDWVRQTYEVEMLYHHLYINPERGMAFFQEHFEQARATWQRVYGRSLLQEARGMTHVLSPSQLCDLDLAEASLLRREENTKEALELYTRLQDQAPPSWLDEHRVDVFYEIASTYMELSSFDQALSYLQKCIELAREQTNRKRLAEAFGVIGYLYRRQGDLEKAVDYYSQSIALNRELGNLRDYADMLNNMGNVQRLLGKFDEAQRYCKIALRIREKLFQQREGGEVPLGWSNSTLGIICLNIGDFGQGEQYFQRAFQIYERNKHRGGIASTYNRFGQIQMTRGEITEAMTWFEQAEEASRDVNSEAYINSLNKQGRVFTRQEKWPEAIERFEAAIEKARQVSDYYQEAESLIDIAEPLELGGRHADSQESLRKGGEIAQRYHYYYLLGRIKQLEGNLHFRAERYQEAFRFLGETCYIMAQYNQVRFEDALGSLEDYLMKTPEEEIPPILKALQQFSWSEKNLSWEYNKFREALEKIENLMVL
jgi:tetratricopeptide (TPR) repeat protein